MTGISGLNNILNKYNKENPGDGGTGDDSNPPPEYGSPYGEAMSNAVSSMNLSPELSRILLEMAE